MGVIITRIHDILEGRPEDEKLKYLDWPRQSGFLAERSWSKKGETQKKQVKSK